MKPVFPLALSILAYSVNISADSTLELKDFNSPEARYARSITQLVFSVNQADRFRRLPDAAIASFEIGDVEKAEQYALEVLALAPHFKDDWNYGNAIYKANTVLGRIALTRDIVEEAKLYLVEAGTTPGSPQLESVGPNMMLAKELLERGETEIVLEFFQLCKHFWEPGKEQLDGWASQVKAGKLPDFELNLY